MNIFYFHYTPIIITHFPLSVIFDLNTIKADTMDVLLLNEVLVVVTSSPQATTTTTTSTTCCTSGGKFVIIHDDDMTISCTTEASSIFGN